MQIKNGLFIVTGASSGIGLATATALSEQGARVALLTRNTDTLREAVRGVHRYYGRVDGHKQRGAQLCGLRNRDRSRGF
jgi:NADP-dependent 3-hydroxy acid dehydrogenase YdfG